MSDRPAAIKPTHPVGTILNVGEPLRFNGVEEFAGFAAEPARGGGVMKVWTRLALTSEQPLFHVLVESLAGFIDNLAQRAGTAVRLDRADTVLLVLKADHAAELWLDTAAVSIRCAVKRSIAAGTLVFENDIADVTAMAFPCVTLDATDKVLCLFRQGWRFGLAFDANPEGKLNIEAFQSALGRLYRELRYWHLYQALADTALFDKLVTCGWFPFVEIINADFRDLANQCKAGFPLSEVEEGVLAKFDEARLERLLTRWLSRPHFAARAELLKAAVRAFARKEPVAVIKILLTEIEGVLNDAHRAVHGKGAKLNQLLAFAEASARERAGGGGTLLFPEAFGRYLKAHTFVNFDPVAQTGTAGSRHAVGHGAAAQDSYTIA